jgi:hypothetical protein
MSRFRVLCIVAIFVGLFVQDGMAAPDSSRAEQQRVIEFVIGHLGFSKSHREALLSGRPVYSGMSELEQLEEEVAAAGAMVLVRRSAAPEVIEAFLDTEVFKQVHDLVRHERIGLKGDGDPAERLFAAFSFEKGAAIGRIANDPARELNLGKAELSRFAELGSADPSVLNDMMRRVLANRLQRYVEQGIDGIEDYVRPNGERVSPADEIRSGLAGLSDLNAAFGSFLDRLGRRVGAGDEGSRSRRLHWVEKNVDQKRVVALLDQSIGHMGDRGMAVEIHYYASSMYNAMVTLVAALPYEDQTLVFAINHTYTDQVRGFGSGMKRRVGRAAIASALADHLQRVRAVLESRS